MANFYEFRVRVRIGVRASGRVRTFHSVQAHHVAGGELRAAPSDPRADQVPGDEQDPGRDHVHPEQAHHVAGHG